MTPLQHKLARDIARSRAQFIAIAVTIFLGVAVFAASYDSFQNLEASYDQTFVDYRFADLTVHGGDVSALAAAAVEVDGVDSVQLRTTSDVPLQVDGVKLLGRIVGFPAGAQPTVNQVKVLRGGLLPGAGTSAVLVEEHMADHFGLDMGEHIELYDGEAWLRVEVAGVVSSPEYIWPARDRRDIITSPDNFGVVFGPERLAQQVAGSGSPNEVVIDYAPGADEAGLTGALTEMALGHGATEVTPRDLQPSNAALSEDIKGFEETALFFPILFLSAAGMAAYVMISRVVYSQRPHIGVMLANGFTRRQVALHYLGYGLVPGIIGSVPGAIVGMWLGRVITRLYTGLLSIPVTLVQFYPATLIVALVFGVSISLISALAPALYASRINPARAMRGEAPSRRGHISVFERVIPPLRTLPIRWRMALRGPGRNLRRTVYTVIGVVLSLVLVLVSWGMLDTVQHLLDRQFVQIQRQDATIYFAAPVSADELDALVRIDGVAAAEPVLDSPVTLIGSGTDYSTTLVALDAGTEMHRFAATTGDWITLPDQGLLIGSAAESTLGVEVGDVVGVTVGSLGLTFNDTIAAFVDEPLGTIAYMSRSRAAELSGVDLPVTSALIRYDAGTDPAELRAAITALPSVAAFEDAKAMYTTVQQFMGLFYGFVGVMLVFGAAMAFALMFNAMSVNVAERSREVATLLAVGTERRSIARLITVENMLVVMIGIPVGLVAGRYVSGAAMASFQSDMFRFDLYLRPTTYVFAALAMVIVALIAQLPGLRMVQRLRIPQIVKERSV